MIFFRLKQLEKTFVRLYVAFPEQVEGKYTFCKEKHPVKVDVKFTAIPAVTGAGKAVNLNHCNDILLRNAFEKSVAKFMLGKVAFFKE